MTTSNDELLVEDKNAVRWIRLHRPRSKNGLTIEVNARIRSALESAHADGIRVLVFTGSDGNFCSGLDLKDAMVRGPIPADRRESDIRDHFHSLIRALRAFDGMRVALAIFAERDDVETPRQRPPTRCFFR